MAFAGFRLSSTSKTVIETASSELAHISRVCLTQYDTPCKYMVQLEVEKGRPYCIGILSDRCPQIMLEHYIQNGSVVWLDGKGEATADLTGYVEPAYSFSDEEEDDEEVSSNSGESSDVEAADDVMDSTGYHSALSARVKAITDAVSAAAEAEKAKAQHGSTASSSSSPSATRGTNDQAEEEDDGESDGAGDDSEQNTSDSDAVSDDEADTDATKASTAKHASPAGDVEMEDDDEDEDDEELVEDDDDDEDEEEDDDDEDDEDDDDDEEAGESGSDPESADEEVTIVERVSEPSKQKQTQQQQQSKSMKGQMSIKGSSEDVAPSNASKKRKGEPIVESAPAAKKKNAASSGPEVEYERALVDELKRLGGRTKISMLGAKVSRPAGLSVKLSTFLKDHPASFVCDGSNVELASSKSM